jgi:hypothetical protein
MNDPLDHVAAARAPLPFPEGLAAQPGDEPLISVILPAHDAASRLPRALRSALSQGVDLEVIVVDDASSDRTLEVARGFAERDPRVRVLHSAVNLGPGGARNLGLAAARGEWIALLDSDDAFLPARFAPMLRAAEGAAMVADNLLLVTPGDTMAGRPMLPPVLLDRPRPVDAAAFLLGNLPIRNHPRVSYGFLKPMIRRDFLCHHGLCYRDGLRFAEDFDFYLRCLLAGAHFVLLPGAGYAYSVRVDSLTARHGRGDLARLRRLSQETMMRSGATAGADLQAAMAAHARSIEHRLIWRMVSECLAAGRPRRAMRLAARSPGSALLVGRELVHAGPAHLLRRLRRQLAPSGVASSSAAVSS